MNSVDGWVRALASVRPLNWKGSLGSCPPSSAYPCFKAEAAEEGAPLKVGDKP